MSKKCCVPGCKQTPNTTSTLHNFPNPYRDHERFMTWVLFVGGEIVGLDNEYIFKNRRICHSHFEEKYFGHNRRIMRNSVPRLNIPVKEAADKSTDIPKFRKIYIRNHNINDKSLNTNISLIQNESSTTLLEEESLDDFSMRRMREQINEESLGNHSSNIIKEQIKEESSDSHLSAPVEGSNNYSLTFIEKDIKEESSNNYPLRLTEGYVKEQSSNNSSLRLTEEYVKEESSNNSSLRLTEEYVKEESSDTHFSVPIEEKIEEEPSNNSSLRLTEEYVKEESSNNSSLRLTEEYIKEESSDTHFSVPIEEKIEEEPSNNFFLRLVEKHVQEEPSSNHSSSPIEQKNDDFSLLQIRKDCAVQYFNKLLTEKNRDALRNSGFGILLAYEMEKVPPRKKFECYNALIATMEKYITKE